MKTSIWLLSRVVSFTVVYLFTVFFSVSFAQQIGVLGNSQYIADNDATPSTTDFTDFDTQTNRTFYIDNVQNSGNSTLTVSSITLSNTTDFSISSGLADNTITKNQSPEPFTVSLLTGTPGTYTSTVTISSDASNDGADNVWTYTISATIVPTYGQPQYSVYYESFDINNGGWTLVTSTNDSWTWTNSFSTNELGEGSFWRNTNFNNYSNNTDIVIESPQLDFTGLQNLQLSLDVKYKTENNTDGMIIQYSVAGGAFTTLGASGSGTNWYDDNTSVFGSDAWNGDGHPASPSFNPHNQFTNARITLSDAIFANQNNVRFRIQFRSNGSTTDDGVAFDNFRIEADPTTALNSASVAPANITNNLRLWLKSNAGVAVADGAALTNWEDQAFDTALDKEDAYAASSLAPTYRDNSNRNLNYNPVLDFDHNNTEYMNGKGGFYSQDYFIVVRSNDDVDTQTGSFSPGRQFAIGGRFASISFHEDPTGLGFGSTSGRYTDEVISHTIDSYPLSGPPDADSYGRASASATDVFNHVLIINVKTNSAGTSSEIYKNGKQIDNVTGRAGNGDDLNFVEFENLPFLVGAGRSGIAGRTTSQLNGMLGEVISYTSPNSALDQQKIQSYLGIKYGTTLQASSSSLTDYRLNDVDYIDSNGSVIWDTSVNSGYNYDIAGIGRDDASLLNQKQSKSQNTEADGTGPTSGFLTMALTETYDTNNANIASNPTTLNDREFLMWGNNNASLNGASTDVTVDMSEDIGDEGLVTNVSFTAIPRIWKVVETGGDVPTVEVSIPISVVRTAAPPNGRYLMFISATGVFDPSADYRVMRESGGYLYTDYDFDGTEYITFGWAPEETFERSVYFNPASGNYIDVEDHLDLNSTGFTISAWIKPKSTNTTIVSKRNVAFTQGYDLRIRSTGRLWFRHYNGGIQQLQSSVNIPMNEWHHVAVIYDGTIATLYIDGVADTSANLPAPLDTTQNFFIGAAGKTAPTDFFDGNIDEVRVWNTALKEEQLRYIMNQEIENNSNFVGGSYFESRSISPTKNDVLTIPWTDLAGYYPMSTYTYTNTKDESGNGHQGALKNLKTVDWQTAPLPYKSTQNGDWHNMNSWENGDVQPIPGTSSIVNSNVSIDWNIVQTSHSITLNDDSDLPAANGGNRSVLALFVDSNEFQIDGNTLSGTGFGLTVTHYLKLDGDIDLEGESQLIQTDDSDLDVTSSGKIERDQQGTADVYTYNYWSSPVGVSNITTNNNSYTLPDVMRDGTQNINWLTSGYDGANTNPISLADYWIWKFANQLDDDYSSWRHVRSTGTMYAGEGFTMKGPGSGSISDDQNYVFLGKPNNGDINLTINAGNDYLIGNPYPSALDAHQFILDNAPVIEATGATTGTLYFWEHWGGGSHNLQDYLGGYATYNLAGGIPAATFGTNDPDVGTGGIPTKLPGRYIPVSQGFFVIGETNGTINFNNGQRIFHKESEGNSTFMEANNPDTGLTPGRSANSEFDNNTDLRMKLRLGLNSINQIHRQLLVTADENATPGVDWGYDGLYYESQMDDMYWMIENEKYTIQGINAIEEGTALPIGIHTDTDGLNSIMIDSLENFPDDLEIFLHDKELEIYHDLRAGDYQIYLSAGEYFDRFEITFSNQDVLDISDVELDTFDVHYDNARESIIMMNPLSKEIEAIEMINILGQIVFETTDVENNDYSEFKVADLSTGTYIIKVNTPQGTFSKKVLVK